MRVAINQPYFAPYAGYFRLMACADVFVYLDDVQHIRRGYVHRCQLHGRDNRVYWLTMPLRACPRDTCIDRLQWAEDAIGKWESQLRRFPIFDKDTQINVGCGMAPQFASPLRFIESFNGLILEKLNIFSNRCQSSNLGIPTNLHGQERIIAICKKLGATTYVNSPGGRDLYDKKTFAKEGIKLEFLPDYENKDSILERMAYENPEDIRREIYEQI